MLPECVCGSALCCCAHGCLSVWLYSVGTMPSDSKKKRDQKKKEAAKKRDVKKPTTTPDGDVTNKPTDADNNAELDEQLDRCNGATDEGWTTAITTTNGLCHVLHSLAALCST